MKLKYQKDNCRLSAYEKGGYYHLKVLVNDRWVMMIIHTDKTIIEQDFETIKQSLQI